MKSGRFGFVVARVLIPLAFVTVLTAQDTAAKPVGERVLSDKALFPKDSELARKLELLLAAPWSDHKYAGIAVKEDNAPTLDAVIKKFGKPDRVVDESFRSEQPADQVHYWGEYGFAVSQGQSSGKIKWVCRRIADK